MRFCKSLERCWPTRVNELSAQAPAATLRVRDCCLPTIGPHDHEKQCLALFNIQVAMWHAPRKIAEERAPLTIIRRKTSSRGCYQLQRYGELEQRMIAERFGGLDEGLVSRGSQSDPRKDRD